MRTAALTLSLLAAASAASATPTEGSDSVQNLLERVAAAPPKKGFVIPAPVKRSPSEQVAQLSHAKRGGAAGSGSAAHLRIAERGHYVEEKDSNNRMVKRWVWGAKIIQDDTPVTDAAGSTTLPPIGVNTNLFSDASYDVATPTASLLAPTFPAVSSSSPSASAGVAGASAVTDKVFANEVVAAPVVPSSSSSSSAASIPPVASSAAVLASSGGLAVARVASPSPTPSVAPVVNRKQTYLQSLASVISVQAASRKAARYSATAKPATVTKRSAHEDEVEKRWLRGSSIIQDGDVAPDPLEGHTPTAALLVAPTFPATSVSVEAAAASVSPIIALVDDQEEPSVEGTEELLAAIAALQELVAAAPVESASTEGTGSYALLQPVELVATANATEVAVPARMKRIVKKSVKVDMRE